MNNSKLGIKELTLVGTLLVEDEEKSTTIAGNGMSGTFVTSDKNGMLAGTYSSLALIDGEIIMFH